MTLKGKGVKTFRGRKSGQAIAGPPGADYGPAQSGIV